MRLLNRVPVFCILYSHITRCTIICFHALMYRGANCLKINYIVDGYVLHVDYVDRLGLCRKNRNHN